MIRKAGWLVVATSFVIACGGPAKRPGGELAALGARFESALKDEAEGREAKALEGALALAKDIARIDDPAGADAAFALTAFLTEPLADGDQRYAGLAHREGRLEDTARALADAVKRGTSAIGRASCRERVFTAV